ncbi:protein tyrosine phosphatase [Kouleothrix sp.]|uniref:arsenate reductase/protein-tyrosine-phosphatase family protein n=1 Tax=Kouleothrix sp. TaxID=2779161 RepID=UPI0039192D5B
MTTILIVGAADTGRAPIAAALLQRLLDTQYPGARAESAGVLGHDGDPAEVEARDTMLHMGIDLSGHRARSVDDALAAAAALLLAIDSGTALVLRGRFPGAAARVATLGELAGRKRDVPDPFRMQIGAWMTYAREIDDMLRAALPAIIGRAGPAAPAPAGGVPEARRAAAERLAQLLQLAATMPDVIDWSVARGRLDGDLAACGSAPAGASDMVAAYVALLRAGLAMLPPKPAATQLGLLQRATTRLSDPVDQAALNELSAQVASLPALA